MTEKYVGFLKRVVFCYFTIILHAGYAQILSLEDIISEIDRSYPELKVYHAKAGAYEAYADAATAWQAPQIGAGFFMTPYNTGYWQANTMDVNGTPMTNAGMGQMMVQVQQMIPNPSRLKADKKYLKSMSTVEKYNRNAARNRLVSEARSYYYDLVILKKQKQLYREQETLLNRLVNLSEKRYGYGKETTGNVYKIRAAVAEIQMRLLQNEGDVHWKTGEINRLMNRDKNLLFEPDTHYIIHAYESFSIDTLKLAESRSDLMAINSNMEVTKYKQQAEMAKAKPDFGIQYAHMSTFGQNPSLFTLMGMMTIPIAPWSSKMYKSNSRAMDMELEAYQRQKEGLINEISSRLKSLQWRLAGKKQQLEWYDNAMLPSLENSKTAALLAYEQNREDLFAVLDAQKNLLVARQGRLDLLREILQLQTEYEREAEF